VTECGNSVGEPIANKDRRHGVHRFGSPLTLMAMDNSRDNCLSGIENGAPKIWGL